MFALKIAVICRSLQHPMARKHSLHILGGSGAAPCGRFHIGGIFQVGGGDGMGLGWGFCVFFFWAEI